MKKLITITLICFCCVTIVQLSFSKRRINDVQKSQIYKLVDKWYTAQTDYFLQQLNILQKLNSSSKLYTFKKQFINTRFAFKKMEVLVSYFDVHAYQNLNSRVKPEVELEKGTYEYIQAPHGLQVIETFLKDDSTYEANRISIDNEIQMAINTAKFLKTYHFIKPYSDALFFNAIKDEMIRIAALGITGFDKPVLKNTIPECNIALDGIKDLVYIFAKSNAKNDIYKEILLELTQSISFIEKTSQDFDDFDRLTFIRNYLQPIFSAADKILKHDDQHPVSSPVFTSFFQQPYIDQLYHQTKVYPAEMINLGKFLFENPILSGNGQLSCANCHHPELNFADTLQFNTGFSVHDTTTRNTPTLLNIKYHLLFQRDGHALFMQDQFREVLLSHIEMGNDSENELIKRIKTDSSLVRLFQKIFNITSYNINFQMVLDPLEAYLRSLTSLNSPFDRYMTYQKKTISPEIKNGFNLFMGTAKCGTCHFMPVFNGVAPPYSNREENEIIGVLKNDDFDNPVLDKDSGLYNTTKFDLHVNAFKVPSVRNLKKTFPYMHNGSLKNIDDLLIFYNVGGGLGMGANVPNQTLDKEPLRLNKKERADIKAFLLSLN